MKLLLDTHVVLWWLGNYPKIKSAWRDAISEPNSKVLVSFASLLEIVVKIRTGKLEVRLADVERLLDQNRFTRLAISSVHLAELERLPMHHRDPFDHILIAQAKSEGATLVSGDRAMRPYQVELL